MCKGIRDLRIGWIHYLNKELKTRTSRHLRGCDSHAKVRRMNLRVRKKMRSKSMNVQQYKENCDLERDKACRDLQYLRMKISVACLQEKH